MFSGCSNSIMVCSMGIVPNVDSGNLDHDYKLNFTGLRGSIQQIAAKEA